MRLSYQPIANFSGGGAVAGINQAASNIGTGLSRIGSGLTALGDRREQRLEKQRQKQEASALERINLLAQQATSEDELNNLTAQALGINPQGTASGGPQGAPRGNVPTGVAAALSARRQNLLANNDARAVTANRIEDTRGTRIANDGSQIGLDRLTAANDAQNKYASEITEAQRLANSGNLEAAQELAGRTSASIAQEFGADVATDLFSRVNTSATEGDTTRTGIVANALGLEASEIANQGSRIGNQGQLQSQSIQREQANRTNRALDYTFGRQQIQDQRADKVFERAETAQEAGALIFQQFPDLEHGLLAIQESNLSPRAKEETIQHVTAAHAADPNIFNTRNPIDPLAPADGIFNENDARIARGETDTITLPDGTTQEVRPPSNSSINPTTVVAEIRQARVEARQRADSIDIFDDVNAIGDITAEDGTPIPVTRRLVELYDHVDMPDKWVNRITQAQNKYNLSDQEVLAIAKRSLGERGSNFLHLNRIPGNERADEHILDVDIFDGIASRYADVKKTGLAANISEINQHVERAENIESTLSRLHESRARTKPDSKERERLNKRITGLNDTLAGLSTEMNTLIGEGDNFVEEARNSVLANRGGSERSSIQGQNIVNNSQPLTTQQRLRLAAGTSAASSPNIAAGNFLFGSRNAR